MRAVGTFGVGIGTVLAVVAIGIAARRFSIDLNLMMGSLGTVATALGLAFGTYFAVLAIDAYGQLRVVKDAGEKAREALEDISRKHSEYVIIQGKIRNMSAYVHDVGESMFTSLHQLIVAMPKGANQAQKERMKQLSDSIILHRARYCLAGDGQGDSVMFGHMATLAELGESMDLDILKNIERDDKYSTKVRDYARHFSASLQQKIAPRQSEGE